MEAKDMKLEAQKFMNEHGLKKCYECDGRMYKHKENANGRKMMSDKPVIEHEANAGPKTEEVSA